MKPKRALLVGCWLGIAAQLLATGADAQTPRDPKQTNFERFPSAAHLHGGFGTPVGLMGLELEHSFVPQLGIAVGCGYSLGGGQAALTALLRPHAWRKHAIVLMPGVSLGAVDEKHPHLMGTSGGDTASSPEYRVEPGYWLNVGAAYEFRSDRGLSFRAYGGYTYLLNRDDMRCRPPTWGSRTCEGTPVMMFPYVGAALGRAF